MNSKILLASLGIGVALALGACGDDDDEEASTGEATTQVEDQPSEAGAQTIDLSETEFKITPAQVSVDGPGTVTFNVSNDGQVAHTLEVERGEEEQETGVIAPGDSATLTVEVEDGTYELYCPIDDHEDKGMKGTLTVGAASGTPPTDDKGGERPEDAPDDNPSGDDSGGASAPDDSDNSGGASAPDDDSGY